MADNKKNVESDVQMTDTTAKVNAEKKESVPVNPVVTLWKGIFICLHCDQCPNSLTVVPQCRLVRKHHAA